MATLNRALHSYFVSLLYWFFLVLRGTEGLLQYSSLQWNAKLFKIDHLPYSSHRKLCCSPFFLKNCEILEKICKKFVKLWAKKKLLWGGENRCEIEWHVETVKVEIYSPYSLEERNIFSKAQLDFIHFLKSSLYFLYQHS